MRGMQAAWRRLLTPTLLTPPPRWPPSLPSTQVENRAYQSRAFRKMHIEVAVRQDGMQVGGLRGGRACVCVCGLHASPSPAAARYCWCLGGAPQTPAGASLANRQRLPHPPSTLVTTSSLSPARPPPTRPAQVFHCVMFPRLTFDLPILSMDLVAVNGRVTLAIIDPCPVTPNLQLPTLYEGPVRRAVAAGPADACARAARKPAWRDASAAQLRGHLPPTPAGRPTPPPAVQGAAGAVPAGVQPRRARVGSGHLLAALRADAARRA